jgi:hypothetical protein
MCLRDLTGDLTGDSTVKRRRSRLTQMIAAGLMAIACVNLDQAIAAEIARPIAISAANPGQIEPTRLHVNPRSGDDQTGDGSLARPFQTITHALDRARSNTIVVLAPGRYSETSGEQFPIQLRSGVTVYGEPDQFGDGIEVVGGGWLMTPTAGEQSVTMLGFDGAGLSGVTVRNPDGSAIWLAGGTPWIVGNTIADNARHGIVAHDGTPYILNNRFDDNDGSDLEFSDRATPQLQDNQLDRRNDQSIGYFGIETGQAIVAANPPASSRSAVSTASACQRLSPPPQTSPPQTSPSQVQTQNRNQSQNQSQNPASEIVTWQGEPSFPPIVTPSDSFTVRAPARLDPTIARSLPLDPDLTVAIENRANSVRSFDDADISNPGRSVAPPEIMAASSRDPFETDARSIAPSLPVRTSVRRLPAAPNVPTVRPVTDVAASPRPNETDFAANPANPVNPVNPVNSASSTASIVAWGTPTNSSNNSSTSATGATTSAAPNTLLRWDALERSTPIATSELPPPIVNPAATSSNPITRPAPIVIASEASSPDAPRRSPVPIRASVEPFDRANLPLAYAPSNATPTWPQPRPTSIPGLIPLPVPDPNPPIGEGGTLPPPPSVTANLSDMPPGLSLTSAPQQLRYRVLVDTGVGLDRVRAIAGSAFTTQIDGREAIQAGVFSDRWRADQLAADLQADGFAAWIDEF